MDEYTTVPITTRYYPDPPKTILIFSNGYLTLALFFFFRKKQHHALHHEAKHMLFQDKRSPNQQSDPKMLIPGISSLSCPLFGRVNVSWSEDNQ
jgi:hypothetical protein